MMIWKERFRNKIAFIIFFLALILRIIFVIAVAPSPLETDAKDYDALGLRLSQGKGYVDSTGNPTAYRPPVYPLFLGGIYSIAGHNLMWVRIVQAILGAGICVLVFIIASITFDGKTAKLAGYMCCFYPNLIVGTSQILAEILFAFLLLLGMYFLVDKKNSFNSVLSGIFLGLALLTRPILVIFFPFLFFWIMLRGNVKRVKACLLLTLGVVLVVAPWTIRNAVRLETFVPFANVGGISLYNSYVVPEKGFGYNSLETIDDEYFQLDNETEQSRFLMKKTLEYIIENPFQIFKLTIKKVLLFVYPFDGYWYSLTFGSKYNIFWGIILGFSAIGIVFNLKYIDINKKLLYFLLASFLSSVVLFYGSPRFRLPLDPILIGFAASGALWLYRKKNTIFYMILLTNVMLFLMFRFFSFQGMFDFFKSG